MKIVEIERCNPFCPYNTMLSLQQMYCQHSNAGKHRAKRIAYSKITDKHPFPDWCPLEDKMKEPKYTFTLNCEKCGNAYDSDFAFPAEQLCPSCNKKRI